MIDVWKAESSRQLFIYPALIETLIYREWLSDVPPFVTKYPSLKIVNKQTELRGPSPSLTQITDIHTVKKLILTGEDSEPNTKANEKQ